MRIEPAKYLAPATALALTLAALVAGCDSGPKEERATGDTLTVYESLPRHGTAAREADAVAAGARLALHDARGRAGGRRVRLVELDSSDPNGVTWDPSAVQANAKRAVRDPTTIAYIGELGEGASAISVPVTNAAGILEVSPADGLTSLTEVDPGGPAHTGPERYYPRGPHTFVRLVPSDLEQAAALATWVRGEGARRLAVVHDERLFGREMAADAAVAAGHAGLTVTDVREARDDPSTYAGLARKLAEKRPDAVLYGGIGDANAAPLLNAIHRALPAARLFATSGLGNSAPLPAGLPDLQLVKPALPARSYAAPARRVLARIARERGAPAEPDALYGYEAMRVVLAAIDASGPDSDDRPAVAHAALRGTPRSSLLGRFRVLPSGAVTFDAFAGYRYGAGGLRYEGIRSPGSALPSQPRAVG